MKNKLKRLLLLCSIVGALSIPSGVAFAQGGITTRCTNGGGNTPNGQYNGQGLTRQNANPHGFAPPGQNR